MFKSKKNINKNSSTEYNLLDERTPFAVKEAFNLLRTNLMYSAHNNENCPIYGITSDMIGAGKSTVAANLAVSFAQSSKRVLLIDGDLRCPTVHKIFGIEPSEVGMSELISGIVRDSSSVLCPTMYENLFVAVGGRIPPNPSELIFSEKLVSLLDEWSEQFDIIFIDFPPVGIVSDALAVCKRIDGYIFVIRSGMSESRSIKEALQTMDNVNAKITGIVFNDINVKESAGGIYGNSYKKNGYPI